MFFLFHVLYLPAPCLFPLFSCSIPSCHVFLIQFFFSDSLIFDPYLQIHMETGTYIESSIMSCFDTIHLIDMIYLI